MKSDGNIESQDEIICMAMLASQNQGFFHPSERNTEQNTCKSDMIKTSEGCCQMGLRIADKNMSFNSPSQDLTKIKQSFCTFPCERGYKL